MDLTGITEERAVAGCNGDSDGYGDGDCYSCGAVHCNGKQWRAGSIYFQDEPGQYYKNDWHFIETYFKLNSIVEGIGIGDGSPVEQVMWIDNMTVATSRVITYGMDDPSIPNSDAKLVLSQNYPNPFLQSTVIDYQLQVSGKVNLKVYNMLGQEIRTLENENKFAGTYSIVWDGKNNSGKAVEPGVYFYQLKTGNKFSETKRMLLLK